MTNFDPPDFKPLLPDDPDIYGDSGLQCCLGFLDVNGSILLHPVSGDRTLVRYQATIQVKTTTRCYVLWCDDSPTGKLIDCKEQAEVYNRDEGANPTITGDGKQQPASFSYTGAVKLGCCTYPCTDKTNTETYRMSGMVPNSAGALTDVVEEVNTQYGFGGSSVKPKFKKCCMKSAGDGVG